MRPGEAAEQIHERAVEERIAFANHRDVVAGGQGFADLDRGAVVDVVRREARRQKRHPDRDLALGARQVTGHDLAREAGADLRRGPGEHRHGLQDAQRFQRHQFGIAGTDADAVQGAGHQDLTAASWVIVIRGFQPVNGPTGSARDTEIRIRSPP